MRKRTILTQKITTMQTHKKRQHKGSDITNIQSQVVRPGDPEGITSHVPLMIPS